MSTLLKLIWVIALVTIFGSTSIAQTYKVMTYNIRLDVPKDGENNWDHRKEAMVDLLNHYQPDILGIQEGMPHQVHYLDSSLTNFNYVGVGRDDGKQKGEFSAVFFNATKFKLIKQSTFWLSEQSEAPSVGWDAMLPRICTYALLEDKETQQRFWFFNTHYDHKGVSAREKSSGLILQKIEEINKDKLPVILTGDFNSEPDSQPIKTLSAKLTDTFYASARKPYGPNGTFNGFNTEEAVQNKIDYIFVKGFSVLSYTHVDDRKKNNFYVSDHLPVIAEIKLD